MWPIFGLFQIDSNLDDASGRQRRREQHCMYVWNIPLRFRGSEYWQSFVDRHICLLLAKVMRCWTVQGPNGSALTRKHASCLLRVLLVVCTHSKRPAYCKGSTTSLVADSCHYRSRNVERWCLWDFSTAAIFGMYDFIRWISPLTSILLAHSITSQRKTY